MPELLHTEADYTENDGNKHVKKIVAGELEAFEHVIPYDEQSCYTAQTVEQGVVRFGVVYLHYFYFVTFTSR